MAAGLSAFIVLSLSTLVVLCIVIVPKVHELHDKVDNLGGLDERVTKLETYGKGLELSEESCGRLEQLLASRTARTPDTQSKSGHENREKKLPEGGLAVPPNERARVKHHEVSSGETLYSIGKRYGISVDQLQRLNGLGTKVTIYPAQALVVGRRGSG